MAIFTYLGEMFDGPAIFLEVLGTGIAKEPRSARPLVCAKARTFDLFSQITVSLHWTWPVWKMSALGTPSKKSG
jgi:hypothetical protein